MIVNIIIPTKNLIELTRLSTDDEDNIEMHIFNNKVIFKFGTIIMMSKLINGTYPDTSKLIPTEFALSMRVSLNMFYDSIDRASLLTNESDKNTVIVWMNTEKLYGSDIIDRLSEYRDKNK